MIARFIMMLAMLSIVVVTTGTAAHAARMYGEREHTMHVAQMMHSGVHTDLSCDAGEHCGSADAGLCEFVCAGLSAFLTSAGGEAGDVHGTASHDVPSEAIHVSRAPGLNERPPKLRFL